MPNPEEDIQGATAIDFFARMNAEGVDYALLRNYEHFPKFHHDLDLVVRWSDLPRWRSVAKSCAIDHGWSVLTECDHWACSSSREHTLQALRFYSTNPPRYLHIDAFHAFLVLGLPLVDEEALLRERTWDTRGFYRINESIENFDRLLQIASVAGKSEKPETLEKIERYRQRVLSFLEAGNDFLDLAAAIGFPKIADSLVLLRSCDVQSFKREIDRQKRAWLIRRVLSHPFGASKMIFDRFVDHLRLFWIRPCGFTIRAFASNEAQRERLEQIMRRLVDANVIFLFTSSTDSSERRRVKERAGIVLDWVSMKSAQIVMDGQADEQGIIAKLLALIIERHPRVWDGRETSG
jgi:hypothetical protein